VWEVDEPRILAEPPLRTPINLLEALVFTPIAGGSIDALILQLTPTECIAYEPLIAAAKTGGPHV